MDRNEVKITAPCTLDWRKMTPAEGGRFCGDCKKVVRDLSSMTEREARSLLKRSGNGELCVRYVLDKKGRIFFGADAPRPDAGLLPATLLSRARRAAAAAAIVALPLATEGCELLTEPLGIGDSEAMGGMVYQPSNDQPHSGPDAQTSAALGASREDAASDASPPDNDASANDPDAGPSPDAEPPVN